MQYPLSRPNTTTLRGAVWTLLFVVLVGLATFNLFGAPVRAETGTVPAGTIPPGGTLPPPQINPDQGQLRVLHLAPFATPPANTAVDLCTDGGAPLTGFTNMIYLQQVGYLPLPAGVYDLKVMTPGCGATIFDLPPFTLYKGSVLTILITGDGVNYPVTTALNVDNPGFSITIYFPLIGAPGFVNNLPPSQQAAQNQ
jgi:hypothetical protein